MVSKGSRRSSECWLEHYRQVSLFQDLQLVEVVAGGRERAWILPVAAGDSLR